MRLKDVRIGYVPLSESLEKPGDRRRFCYYAKKRNIHFEMAKPSETYDLVIVTERGDISVWSKYHKGNAKLVYDFIDSYLAIPRFDVKGNLRGLAKFISRESRYLRLNHWKALENMCKRADAVICTTEEQQNSIAKYCKNVHIILDIHSNVVSACKTDYSTSDVFNFVWEGLPENLLSFYEIRDVLDNLKTEHKIAFHIVTDLEYYRYMGKYLRRRTANFVHMLFDKAYLYEWNEQRCSTVITSCDMALIPVSLSDPFASGKPENKLLLFWRMGMPAVVSATPSHIRAMHLSGLSMACRSQEEWRETLERYINDASARQEAGQRAKAFAEQYYSEEKILAQWDSLMESVLS
jgi:glycosyltransferase involved in cell wall biosynthesis